MKLVLLCCALLCACLGGARADCGVLLDFPNESAALTGPSRAILNRILAVYPNSSVSLTGYADMAANPTGNRVLARARAGAVQGYLTQNGAAPSQVSLRPRRDLPDLGGTIPSKRLVQIRITPCDPAVLQAGAANVGAAGGLGPVGGGLGAGLLALVLAALVGTGGDDGGSTTTTTTAP